MEEKNVPEEDLIPLSAIQHMAFCPRQCALIHIERFWEENIFTAEGNLFHEKAHSKEKELRGDKLIVRGLRIRSIKLGLIGKADVVEFQRNGEGIKIKDFPGFWVPFPVEYKRGRKKTASWDRIQLCAQALCLEEMLKIKIEQGALYYGQTRRREEVVLERNLRLETIKTIEKTRKIIFNKIVPPPKYQKKCKTCSLKVGCLPKITGKSPRKSYIEENLLILLDETIGDEKL